jgi:hypothetical protein
VTVCSIPCLALRDVLRHPVCATTETRSKPFAAATLHFALDTHTHTHTHLLRNALTYVRCSLYAFTVLAREPDIMAEISVAILSRRMPTRSCQNADSCNICVVTWQHETQAADVPKYACTPVRADIYCTALKLTTAFG